ncbi:hypothetical protein [Microbacterium sp. NPDC057944]|uniref:hypothetical protein n=1 Tax=Microbacterium sp. NPDC057944 TaxID=3346286 RepID=UPI0036DA25CF
MTELSDASTLRQMLSEAMAAEGASESLRPLAQVVLHGIKDDGTATFDQVELLAATIGALSNLESRIVAIEKKLA